MTKFDRELYWEYKESFTIETKSKTFVLETDLKDHSKYSKSKFVFNSVGRNLITILRHVGKIKEVRGNGRVRIVLQ
jgi:hypothetical protein